MTKVTYRVELRNDQGGSYRFFNIDIEGNSRVEREEKLIKNVKQMHPEAARTSFQEVKRIEE